MCIWKVGQEHWKLILDGPLSKATRSVLINGYQFTLTLTIYLSDCYWKVYLHFGLFAHDMEAKRCHPSNLHLIMLDILHFTSVLDI